MHPLRITMYVSLATALAVSVAFGYALHRLAVAPLEVVVLAGAVFIAFMVPWVAAFTWALQHAGDLDHLTERTRAVIERDTSVVMTDRPYHQEVDDLARAVEELRQIILRQRERAEERESAMQQIIDALGEGLLAIDAKGRVVIANASVRQTLGIEGEVQRRPFIEVVRNGQLAEALARAVGGQPSSARVDIAERQVEIRVSPVRSQDMAAIALFIDVTDIERLQRIRRDFLDDFSHEVRTPLAGLRAAVESFERRLGPEQEDQLRGVMVRQLTRIERLVQDLAELNQIESGGLTLDRRDVDLLRLATDLVEEFRRRVEGQPVVLAVRGTPAVAHVDAARVQQIVDNLLDNACKYGGSRGEITVEVTSDGRDAILRVSDEGEGIPPADLSRIFNRFYRVDRSRSQQVPGVGLGLAIAKHLTAVLHGSIRAYNREPRGATFEVRLPLAQTAEERRAG